MIKFIHKRPLVGQLVLTTFQLTLCGLNPDKNMKYHDYGVAGLEPEFIKGETPLLYLGTFHYWPSKQPIYFPNKSLKYVFKFLNGDKIMYTEPKNEKPSEWLSKYVKVVESGNKT